jgi:uncharacterized protein with NRDE domain
MCLLVVAWQVHPRYRLVVAANRDEFHERPTAPMARWQPPDDIVAGRDLRAGGTWLGLDRRRRFGVVTNFRELQRPATDAPSRGGLVPGYLRENAGAERYLAGFEPSAPGYSGFNLLVADEEQLWYASNRAERFARLLPPGVYGLSNEFLDTPWPKLRRVRRRFESWLALPHGGSTEELFAILADLTQAGVDEELPKTGLSPEWEQLLSSPFVRNPDYGTRCSTVLLLEPAGALYLAERRFDARGLANGETEFDLDTAEWL